MFKVIIAGGRDFNDYDYLCRCINHMFQNIDLSTVEIVSGKAKGADSLGEQWAKANGVKVQPFPADWKNLDVEPCLVRHNKHGAYNALAGIARNHQMGNYADALIAFWDEKSTGTKDMIDYANNRGLRVKVFNY